MRCRFFSNLHLHLFLDDIYLLSPSIFRPLDKQDSAWLPFLICDLRRIFFAVIPYVLYLSHLSSNPAVISAPEKYLSILLLFTIDVYLLSLLDVLCLTLSIKMPQHKSFGSHNLHSAVISNTTLHQTTKLETTYQVENIPTILNVLLLFFRPSLLVEGFTCITRIAVHIICYLYYSMMS